MLRDLTVKNYRAFREFQLGGLARINLLVGMNNSGKTSLLEAVYLLVSQGDPQRLAEILYNRGETAERLTGARGVGDLGRRWVGYQVSHLFYGHELHAEQAIQLLSRKERHLSLQIQLQPTITQAGLFLEDTSESESPTFGLLFRYGTEPEIRIPIRNDGSLEARSFRFPRQELTLQEHPHRFLTTSNLDFSQLAELWDRITLTPKEEDVIRALQILEPTVERISFTSRQTPTSGILVKMKGRRDPIPLGSMGDGMRRILTLAASAVMAEGGVLLVDEIDTGLYHATQASMWRLIIETAQRLDVQVFATTHSWDCVRAFKEALLQPEADSVGMLLRLESRNGNVRAVTYSSDELAIAVREAIEVR